MYNIIPLALILISLSVIIYIAVKKFPVLANLDVNSIPKEKEAKFKEQIISGRLKRSIVKWSSRIMRALRPAVASVSVFFKWVYAKLHEIKESYKAEEVLPRGEREKKISELFSEADEFIENEKFEEAEKKLIEIINMDNRNIEAFKTLGELYFEQKDYEGARETFEHVLRLEKDSQDGEIFFELALVYKEMGNIGETMNNIKRALAVEPNNPRYLDTALQISIINKDKAFALDSYKKLKKANPENQKLGEFKKQINEI